MLNKQLVYSFFISLTNIYKIPLSPLGMDSPHWVPAAEEDQVLSIKWPWVCIEFVKPIVLYTDSYDHITPHGMQGKYHTNSCRRLLKEKEKSLCYYWFSHHFNLWLVESTVE